MERAAAQLSECAGIAIDLLFVPNDDFSLKSLEDERAGIELLTVTEVDAKFAKATLFVPDGKLSVLEGKVRKFQESATHRKPRNAPLVSSLESIRRAAARSYWTDASKPFPSETGELWWEVWLRKAIDPGQFRKQAQVLELHVSARQLDFPDRTVLLVRATVAHRMKRNLPLTWPIGRCRLVLTHQSYAYWILGSTTHTLF